MSWEPTQKLRIRLLLHAPAQKFSRGRGGFAVDAETSYGAGFGGAPWDGANEQVPFEIQISEVFRIRRSSSFLDADKDKMSSKIYKKTKAERISGSTSLAHKLSLVKLKSLSPKFGMLQAFGAFPPEGSGSCYKIWKLQASPNFFYCDSSKIWLLVASVSGRRLWFPSQIAPEGLCFFDFFPEASVPPLLSPFFDTCNLMLLWYYVYLLILILVRSTTPQSQMTMTTTTTKTNTKPTKKARKGTGKPKIRNWSSTSPMAWKSARKSNTKRKPSRAIDKEIRKIWKWIPWSGKVCPSGYEGCAAKNS